MAIDHDQIFKALLELFFREFLELFCPQDATAIDFRHVQFLKQEYFTDAPRGRRKVMDLVVQVRLVGGGEKHILVHFEFEASRKEKDFPRQMFKRLCALFSRHDMDVLPIAVFTDDSRWRKDVPDHFEIVTPGKTVVRFQYHLIKLKHLDYRTFLRSNNPLAFALMAKMNYNRKDRVRLKADFLRLILGALVDTARASVLTDFVETYMVLEGKEQTQFQRLVQTERQYKAVEKMITTYENEGMKKGRAEGQQQALILQLERKFGELSPAVKKKIRQIDSPKKLESMLLLVLDARSLDEVEL